jgi:hypothetical protein
MKLTSNLTVQRQAAHIMNFSSATACLLVTSLLTGGGEATAGAIVDLSADGPPACASQTRGQLRRDVKKLAGRNSSDAAWRLVEVFLCGSHATALQTIEPVIAAHVTHKIATPTGVETRPLVNVNEELGRQLPSGKAWGPDVRMEDERMVVYYSIDRYCWNFFGLRFVNRRWEFDLLGGGCD